MPKPLRLLPSVCNVARAPSRERWRRAGLDLKAALLETGVAVVTSERGSGNDTFAAALPAPARVFSVSPVSLTYVVIKDLLVAHATNMVTGEPVAGVEIAVKGVDFVFEVRLA